MNQQIMQLPPESHSPEPSSPFMGRFTTAGPGIPPHGTFRAVLQKPFHRWGNWGSWDVSRLLTVPHPLESNRARQSPGHSRALTLLPATRSFTCPSPQFQPPAWCTHTHTHTHCPLGALQPVSISLSWGCGRETPHFTSQAHSVCCTHTCSLQTEMPTYWRKVRPGAPAACQELRWRLHQLSQWWPQPWVMAPGTPVFRVRCQKNGHIAKSPEVEQTLGDGGGQRSLVCYHPWGHRVRHDRATEQQ